MLTPVSSVVISPLQEIDSLVPDHADDPVFRRQTARPCSGRQILQRFRLSDSCEEETPPLDLLVLDRREESRGRRGEWLPFDKPIEECGAVNAHPVHYPCFFLKNATLSRRSSMPLPLRTPRYFLRRGDNAVFA